MAYERNAMIKLFWKIHPKLYQWSGGRIGKNVMGLPVLLLTTTGRKSGQARTKALTYFRRGEDYVVIASNLGADFHPAWWLNLQADPGATIQAGNQEYSVRAREAVGEERAEIWQMVVNTAPAYDEYRAQTDRQIPVVVLEQV